MARYIDADALGIGKADRNAFEIPEYADGWNSAIEIIANAPTADVVPKSEVEHLKAEIERLERAFKRYYNDGKKDGAREIFEEIEDVLDNIGYFDEIDFKALKKKYTEG